MLLVYYVNYVYRKTWQLYAYSSAPARLKRLEADLVLGFVPGPQMIMSATISLCRQNTHLIVLCCILKIRALPVPGKTHDGK